jgi:crotonobetainyl-CoA:carnitine CoA-transferase CaiB-like acyl-CoA transferase
LDKVLENIRVIDLSHHTGPPYCSMLMADFGADVIKIERPSGGDFMRANQHVFLAQNRNKKSITLNLNDQLGREVFYRLAKTSDVVLENYRPGVVKRLGVDYETIKEINKRIVYCSISAFGQEGPYRGKPGLGVLAQSVAGITGLTGYPDRSPALLPVALADFTAGMLAFGGIMMGLIARNQTDRGQKVDVSLLDSSISVLQPIIINYFLDGKLPERSGCFTPRGCPDGVFQTKDSYMNLIVQQEEQWPRLCSVLGRESLATDPRFESNIKRYQHQDELIPIIEGILKTRFTEEWLKLLEEQDLLCAPINNIEQVIKNPQVLKNEMIVSIDDPHRGKQSLVGVPIKLSDTPGKIRSAAPMLGQHTEEVLLQLGYQPQQIQEMRVKKVI